MDALQRDMAQVKRALFGDPDNLRERPGVVTELGRIDTTLQHNTRMTTDIRNDLRKVVWVVITAVIVALLYSILKHPSVMGGG